MESRLKVFLVILLFSCALHAQKVVNYAGFCFNGDYSDISTNYRYTFQITQSSEDSQNELEKLFYDYFLTNPAFKNFTLNMGSERSGNYSLAIALNREDLAFEYFEDSVKSIYDLGCTIFIMDFNEMTVVQSYPLNVTYIDLSGTEPSESEIINNIKMLYRDHILKFIMQNQSSIVLKSTNTLSLKVANVYLSQEVADNLTKESIDSGSYARAVAQHLTESLAFKMNLTVLPTSQGNLTQKMSLSFSDSSVQNYTIPASSYDVDLTVKKFVKQPYEENDWERVDLYGTRVEFRIYDAEFGNEYWKEDVVHAEAKKSLKSQVIGSDHNIFNEVLLLALSNKLPEVLKVDKKLMKKVLEKCVNL